MAAKRDARSALESALRCVQGIQRVLALHGAADTAAVAWLEEDVRDALAALPEASGPRLVTMTRATVRERVDAISRASGDFERAHSLEDQLFEDVLLAVARGEADDPRAVAEEALESTKLVFQRACA